MDWRLPLLGTIILWGFQGILLKKASQATTPWHVLTLSGIVWLLISLIVILKVGFPPLHTIPLVLAAVLSGAFGFVLLLFAISSGPVSIVYALSTLFLAVTTILAWLILHEQLTPVKIMGIILAMLAAFLLSL